MSGEVQIIADRYELRTEINSGGMGDVWHGFDPVLNRDVAIKRIRRELTGPGPDAEEFAERFRREARVTAKFDHPGVPAIYDAVLDESADGVYMVMQLVRGTLLTNIIASRGPLPIPWAVSVVAQICSVLSHAHAVPVVHRDLKPDNIMIAADGTVKVLDFGIAAVLGTDVTKLTSTGHIIGTRRYMSPEQIQCAAVSPRSDLYSLGCILYELLAGRRPFDAESEFALMEGHMYGRPTPLRELRAEVDEALEALTLELLAKVPHERPACAQDVHDRLVPFLPPPDAQPTDAPQSPGPPDPTSPYRRPLAPRPRPVTEKAAPTPALMDAPAISDQELDQARNHAAALVEEERFSQAAGMLEEILAQALASRPANESMMIRLKIIHALALFYDEDYGRALPEYDALAEVIGAAGPDRAEDALYYRSQAAFCRMELGDSAGALAEYQEVLARLRLSHPETSDPVLEVRRHVGQLLFSGGRLSEAAEMMIPLYRDLVEVYGAAAREAGEVRDALVRIRLRTSGNRRPTP
ncbi:protein kinase domain-containing protein [Streptomyces asiaticus]|uniref:serine/threonine-protein kinase n=1 Tax=Streptomyces asiaticus TaxID=114695 RepID=UPI003D724336